MKRGFLACAALLFAGLSMTQAQAETDYKILEFSELKAHPNLGRV